MKDNPKKLIVDINAVKIVYVESCYKIFMSAYKESNNNDDISHVSKGKSDTWEISSLLFDFCMLT